MADPSWKRALGGASRRITCVLWILTGWGGVKAPPMSYHAGMALRRANYDETSNARPWWAALPGGEWWFRHFLEESPPRPTP